MKTSRYIAILLFAFCAIWSVSAEAAKRVALVIGNDRYAGLPSLMNARTDAKGVAKKLEQLGFEVILRLDASSRDFSRALADFEGRLKSAEAGIVFYAGHGIQVEGMSYLVPSDARIEIEADLRFEGIRADEFLAAMERAGTPLSIVILDACRDNPLPRRSRYGARGLAVPIIPEGIKGTAVVYSAAPGQVAQDGPPGGHGVFTGELLKVLDRPNLPLEKVFKETAIKVSAATNGRQDPWIVSSVKGDFYFNETSSDTPGSPSSTGAGGKFDVRRLDLSFWDTIKDSEDSDLFDAYLAKFPNGVFSAIARIKSDKLRKIGASTKIAERRRRESEAKRLAELERERAVEEVRRKATAERKRQESEAKRLAELERQRVAAESRRKATVERKRVTEGEKPERQLAALTLSGGRGPSEVLTLKPNPQTRSDKKATGIVYAFATSQYRELVDDYFDCALHGGADLAYVDFDFQADGGLSADLVCEGTYAPPENNTQQGGWEIENGNLCLWLQNDLIVTGPWYKQIGQMRSCWEITETKTGFNLKNTKSDKTIRLEFKSHSQHGSVAELHAELAAQKRN
jgi:hypothetical protein